MGLLKGKVASQVAHLKYGLWHGLACPSSMQFVTCWTISKLLNTQLYASAWRIMKCYCVAGCLVLTTAGEEYFDLAGCEFFDLYVVYPLDSNVYSFWSRPN